MTERTLRKISIGVLLPFDYNLFQVSILLDVFTKVNQLSEEQGLDVAFDVYMMQTQGQINEYSDTFFHFPVVNTFFDKIFDYIIIPPCNSNDVQDILEKNKVFKDWILDQIGEGAYLISIDNGIVLTAYSGLLEDKEIALTHVPSAYFKEFSLKKSTSVGKSIQHFEKLTLGSGKVQIFSLLIDFMKQYFSQEFLIHMVKHYQIDISSSDNRYFQDFDWVYETNDCGIDAILDKMHHQYHQIKSIEELLVDYPESRRNFNRKFLDQVRLTPIEYLQNIRISVAKRILETTEIPVEDLAPLVGYEDAKSLRFIFSRITGLSPLEYRKKWRF